MATQQYSRSKPTDKTVTEMYECVTVKEGQGSDNAPSNVVPFPYPSNENVTVADPRAKKRQNSVTPDFLLYEEVAVLYELAKRHNRYGLRDSLMIHLAYRFGLRANEVVNLQWGDINLSAKSIHIRRSKGGKSMYNRLIESDLRRIGAYKKVCKQKRGYLFLSEREFRTYVPSPDGNRRLSPHFYRRMIERVGDVARSKGLLTEAFDRIQANHPDKEPRIHSHMLRHGCGYHLINKNIPIEMVQDILGHQSIMHTRRYTQINPSRFDDIADRWDQ